MSLIEEALRRLREPATVPQQPTISKPLTPPLPQAEPPPAHSWTAPEAGPASGPEPTLSAPSLLAAGAALVLVAAAAMRLGGIHGASGALGQSSATPHERAAPAPLSRPSLQDQLVLNGVVEGPGTHYALINGAVVAVGELVGGLTLTEATRGAAKLRGPDGTETTLRIAR